MIDRLKKKYKKLSINSRSIFHNVIGAFIIKGASLVLALVTMPAYMHYFNNQTALGVWFTILSILSWMLNFDFGIGNGLRNNLARTFATGEDEESKRYISVAYLSVGCLAAVIIIIFCLSFPILDWNRIFHIEDDVIRASTLNTVVLITFIGIMAQLFLKLISSVLYAMNKSVINNFLALITSFIVYFFVAFLPSTDNSRNIIIMAWLHTLAVVIPLLFTNLLVFGTKLRNARPSLRYFRFSYAKRVLSLGGAFFFVQIMYMLIMSTNEYLITALSGNAFVVEYQIYAKLFTSGSTIFALAITPVWSMVTKALAQKDFIWVRNLYRKLLFMGGICCAAELSLVVFLQRFIDAWLKERTIITNPLYGLIFAIIGCLMILNSILSSVANGAGELKTQAVFFGIGALIKIPLAFIFVSLFHSWIGVVIANVVAMGIYCLIQPIWLKRYICKMEMKVN